MNLQSVFSKLRLHTSQLLASKKLLPAEELTAAVRQCAMPAAGEAIAERLDEFVELESHRPGVIEYCTVHGCRIVSSHRPELNLFVVLKKGQGFARAVPLPYVYSYNSKHKIPQLRVVEYNRSDALATTTGWAGAIDLPYVIASDTGVYPNGTLVVSINATNHEATSAGYANALPWVALEQGDIYIEDLKMLDTQYANSLVDFPRFG